MEWVEIPSRHDQSHEYSDDCPGCQPAILNVETGLPLPPDSPVMKVVLEAFKTKTTLAQRLRWHRVVVQNSRNPDDLRVVEEVAKVMQEAMEKYDAEKGKP